MNYRTKLLTAGAAAALAGLANAQIDYTFNWQTPNIGFNGGLAAFSGPGLFGALSGDGHYATTGDSIRICYGIDQMQGGRNEDGNSDVTWFRLVGSYAPNNTLQVMEFGITSFEASTVDSLDGDACFSPFFGQAGQTSVTTAAFQIGTIGGTGANPFPTFWFVSFQFLGSTGLQMPNVLGTAAGAPLLSNIIFEVQGPTNNGPSGNNYFLAATSEIVGTTVGAPGGVTNGNDLMGNLLAAAPASSSAAYAHYRINATDPVAGLTTGTFGIAFGGQTPDVIQFFTALGSQTPYFWAANDGNTGAGGADLRIGSAPVSTFQWRVLDITSGGEGAGGPTNPGGTTSSITNPGLAANLPVALYSVTSATAMLQTPMSWDNTLGPPSPGSDILNAQGTSRAGLQTIPANFDPLTNSFLSLSDYTVGTNFLGALDNNADGDLTNLFEDGVGLGIGGSANMAVALPVAAAPNAGLVGVKVGVAALGIQFDLIANTLGISEVASAMTINLQQ